MKTIKGIYMGSNVEILESSIRVSAHGNKYYDAKYTGILVIEGVNTHFRIEFSSLKPLYFKEKPKKVTNIYGDEVIVNMSTARLYGIQHNCRLYTVMLMDGTGFTQFESRDNSPLSIEDILNGSYSVKAKYASKVVCYGEREDVGREKWLGYYNKVVKNPDKYLIDGVPIDDNIIF